MVAEYQNVVYGQYLEAVIGSRALRPNYCQGTTYDPEVNPAMSNEFATAGFRFGHSMLQGTVPMLDIDDPDVVVGSYDLRNVFFDDEFYVNNTEQILQGFINTPSQGMDNHFTEELSNHLNANIQNGLGSDLASRNIHRGRDHGLPGFCCYYRYFQDYSFDCTNGWDTKYE